MRSRTARTFGIDCDFRRVDGYLFGSRKELAKEREAARRAGLLVDQVDRAPLPFDTGPCLRFANQAEFHPLAYIRGSPRPSSQVASYHYERPRRRRHCRIAGEDPNQDGRTLHAAAVVDTTDTTITSVLAMPTRDAAYRSYVMAFDVAPVTCRMAVLGYRRSVHYVRVAAGPRDVAREILIAGGEDHRVGHDTPENRWPKLEAWVREHFVTAGAAFARWSGQIMEPPMGSRISARSPANRTSTSRRVTRATG